MLGEATCRVQLSETHTAHHQLWCWSPSCNVISRMYFLTLFFHSLEDGANFSNENGDIIIDPAPHSLTLFI